MNPASKIRFDRAGHSQKFQDYLDQQTPERRAEILKAEQAYLETSLISMAHLARDFEESMVGYEERPSGPPSH